MKKALFIAVFLISTVTFAQKAEITKIPTEPVKIGDVIKIEGAFNAGENQTVELEGVGFVLRVFDTNTQKFLWKASKNDGSTKGKNKGTASVNLKVKNKELLPSSELAEGQEYRVYMTFKNSNNRWIANWKTITLIK